jgi:hypothetical protein
MITNWILYEKGHGRSVLMDIDEDELRRIMPSPAYRPGRRPGADVNFDKLAKAGAQGLAILAVIAAVAGALWLFCKLPRAVQLLAFLALFGWGVWTWASYKNAPYIPSPDEAVVEQTPAPRAALVNAYPKH